MLGASRWSSAFELALLSLNVVVVSLEGPYDASVRTGVEKKKQKNRPPHFCLTLIRPRAESTNQINIKLVMIRACMGAG